MSEIQVTDQNFEEDVLKSPLPVVVDFWAPWCGPCRAISPVIAELAQEFNGKIKVAKLNSDDNPNVTTRHMITAIPTLLFFKQGKVMDQLVGVHSKAEISARINKLLS